MKAQTPDAPPAAQQGPPPGGPAGAHRMEERRIEMLTKHLDLTPEQVNKVKAIDVDTRAQMMALRDDTATTRDQKRPKMEAIRNDQQAKIKTILTDGQKIKFEAMEAQMRERRIDHREDGRTPPPPPPAPQS